LVTRPANRVRSQIVRLLRAPLVLASVLLFATCDFDKLSPTTAEDEGIKAENIVIGGPTSLNIGQTGTMTVTAAPFNIADVEREWSSSAPTKVSINAASGFVTGLAAGTSSITVTLLAPELGAGLSKSVTVTVLANVSSVTVTPNSAAIASGTTTFTAVARDAVGAAIPGKTITFATLNPNVATINSSTGVLTAITSGQTTVSATADGIAGYALATVGMTSTTAVTTWTSQTGASAQTMRGVWGHASNDVFAAGHAGTIQRYNGTSWTTMTSGVTQDLYGVWGTSNGEVIAVGQTGTVRRYNGVSWSAMNSATTQNLNAVWGASSREIYAVGDLGTIRQYTGFNGTDFVSLTSGTTQQLLGVWGASSTEVFAVGAGGTILRYNGTAWAAMTSGTTQTLMAVSGTSGSNVFAVGANGTILRYDGTAWSPHVSGTTQLLTGVWMGAANDGYAVGAGGTTLRYTGSGWVSVTSGTASQLNAVVGAPSVPSTVFSVGAGGVILRGNRSAVVRIIEMTPKATTTTGSNVTFTAIARDADSVVVSGKVFTWASLNPSVATINASTGVATPVASGQAVITATVDGVTGYALLTVALGGQATTSWATSASGITATINGLWASSASEIFAAADGGAILRYNGTAWSSMTSGTTSALNGIWGSSGSDVYVAGASGTIRRYNGTAWAALTTPTTLQLNAIWGASPSEIFAVGASGTVIRYNGSAWVAQTSGTTQNLVGVWGNSAWNVFAVGDAGTIMRYNGISWSAMTSGTTQNLLAVWGTSAADVYAVGASGTILRYNGTSWSAMSSGTTALYRGVWGAGSSDIYAVANSGVISRYNGTGWTAQVSGTTSDLYDVFGTSSGSVWVSGANGTIRQGTRGVPVVTTVEMSPIGTTISIPSTQVLTPTAKDASGQTITGKTFTFSSLNTNVATVSGGGTVTPVAAGQVTVCATTDGVTGCSLITVAPSSISIITTWLPLGTGLTTIIREVWCASPTDCFAAGDAGAILRYNGTAWTAMSSGTANGLNSIWGFSSTDVYAVGNSGTIRRFNGTAWSTMTSGIATSLLKVWGASPSNVFATGFGGVILRYNGTAWAPMTSSTTDDLWAIWGTAENDVWVGGSNGAIRRYNGTGWAGFGGGSGTTQTIFGMWGGSIGDIFAVGDGGTAIRFNGSSWAPTASTGTALRLNDVWGTVNNDIYAVGNGGTIIRFNGSAWSTQTSGTSNDLHGLWGSPSNYVHAVGFNGTALRGGVGPVSPSLLGAASVSATGININWTDNSANEDGFRIERCAGVSCSGFAEIATVGSNVTAYGDATVSAGTSYSYRVRAYNVVANSGYSNTATANTSLGTPTVFTAVTANRTAINLAWTDNSSIETGFEIQRCLGVGCSSFSTVTTTASNATTYNDVGLAAASEYNYRIRALGSGLSSTYAPTKTARTPTVVTSGTPVAGISDVTPQQRTYVISVPVGTSNLTVSVSGFTGDADLYLKAGSSPDPENAVYDCQSASGGTTTDSCSIPSPTPGDWFISVYAYTSYSGATLTPTITSGPVELIQNGSFTSGSASWATAGSNVVVATSGSEAAGTINSPPGGASSPTCGCLGYRTSPGYVLFNVDGSRAGIVNASGEVSQNISVPTGGSTVTLTYYVSINTNEDLSGNFDNLTVTVTPSGSSPITVDTRTEQNRTSTTTGVTYVQRSIDLSAYKGQTISVKFAAASDVSFPTVFRIDDVSVIRNP
jgi:uncharacterized protein YjdB